MVLLPNIQTDIKQLNIAYLEQLQKFHHANFQNHHFSTESFKSFLTQNFYKTFGILTKENLIIAYITFSHIIDEAEIIFIGVKYNFRNLGFASKLLNVPRETFSISKMFLEVSVENYEAINLYKKQNFKTLSIRKNYFSNSNFNNKDAFLMVKNF